MVFGPFDDDLRSPEKLREKLAELVEKGPEPLRPFHLWRLLGWTFAAIFAALFLDFVGSAIWRGLHPGQPSDAFQNGALASVKLIIELAVASLVLMIGVSVNGHQVFDYLGFVRPAIGRTAIVLSGVIVLYLAVLIGWSITLGPPVGVLIYRQWYQSAETLGALPLLWVAFIVAAPFGEEIIFRGFFFRTLNGWGLSARLVVVITSCLWTLTHFPANIAFLIFVFILGLVLGSLRQVTGSIVPTIALHMMVNLVVTAIFGMGTGPAPPQGWHKQYTHEGAFSIAFPNIPEYKAEQMTASDGGAYILHQYLLRTERGRFSAFTRGASNPDASSNPRVVLQRMADAMKGVVRESQSWRTVQGRDALEIVGVANGSTRTRILMLLTSNGYIVVQYFAPAYGIVDVDNEVADQFFNSVRPES